MRLATCLRLLLLLLLLLLAGVELDEVVEREIESLTARRSQHPRTRRRAAAARRPGWTGEVLGRRPGQTHVAARLTDARLTRRRCACNTQSSRSSPCETLLGSTVGLPGDTLMVSSFSATNFAVNKDVCVCVCVCVCV